MFKSKLLIVLWIAFYLFSFISADPYCKPHPDICMQFADSCRGTKLYTNDKCEIEMTKEESDTF